MNPPKPISALIDVPDLENDSKTEVNLEYIELQAVDQVGFELPAGKYRSVEIFHCKLEKLLAHNVSTFRASFIRSVFKGCQMTGIQLPEGAIKHVVFKNCRLNLTNFRNTAIENCIFEDSDLTEADFSGATFSNTLFINCQLDNVEFSNCINKRLEFEGCSLAQIKGISGLGGSTITNQNLLEIAPLLAHELNIKLRD